MNALETKILANRLNSMQAVISRASSCCRTNEVS